MVHRVAVRATHQSPQVVDTPSVDHLQKDETDEKATFQDYVDVSILNPPHKARRVITPPSNPCPVPSTDLNLNAPPFSIGIHRRGDGHGRYRNPGSRWYGTGSNLVFTLEQCKCEGTNNPSPRKWEISDNCWRSDKPKDCLTLSLCTNPSILLAIKTALAQSWLSTNYFHRSLWDQIAWRTLISPENRSGLHGSGYLTSPAALSIIET